MRCDVELRSCCYVCVMSVMVVSYSSVIMEVCRSSDLLTDGVNDSLLCAGCRRPIHYVTIVPALIVIMLLSMDQLLFHAVIRASIALITWYSVMMFDILFRLSLVRLLLRC